MGDFESDRLTYGEKSGKHEYCEQTYCDAVGILITTTKVSDSSMTPQEFLEHLATAETDPEKLMVVARYLDTTAMDNATTPKWRSIPYSSEIEMALNNLAFHLEALAESRN